MFFLLALIGYHTLPHEYARNSWDLGKVIEGGKGVYHTWKDGLAKTEEGRAQQAGETVKDAVEIAQGLGIPLEDNADVNSLFIWFPRVFSHVEKNLNDVKTILANLKDLSKEAARTSLESASTILKSVEKSLNFLSQVFKSSDKLKELESARVALAQRVAREKLVLALAKNESRSWASFCKAFLKVWDVIVKVVDAIFRGNDFDENVLLDVVEQKLGRSFQTRQITRTRVDGGVWIHGTADNIALSAYFHPDKAHSVAIKTGLSAKILPEKQQVAQAGEWAVALGPVESAEGNQALYRFNE